VYSVIITNPCNSNNGSIRWSTFLTIYFFLSLTFAFPQNTRLINYSIREGLPSSEVYEVFQDSHGFIWFATDHGVVKFDGYEMKILTVKDGLSDPVVFGFSEDEQQRLWFRTYSGKISYQEKNKIHSIRWNDQLQRLIENNLVYTLYSYNDEIHISTERFFARIHSNGEIMKEEIGKHELALKITPNKKLLYGLNGLSNRVSRVKINDKYYPIQLTDTLTHNKVICGLQDETKALITINSDIFEFNGSLLKKVFSGRAPIISLSKDLEGYYWVGYANQGVDRLSREDYRVSNKSNILTNLSITKVLQDLEGNFWFSTLEDGIHFTSNLETVIINLEAKIRFATFNSKYAVIGDQLGVISTYDLNNGKLLWKKDLAPPTRSLFIDVQNQLWVSTQNTSILDLKTGEVKKKITGSYTSFSMESDSIMWAVGGLRLTKFKLSGSSEYVITNSLHINILYENSNLYTSGRTGMEIFDSKTNLINKPMTLSNSKITSIIPFDDEFVLVSTIGNGFHLINKNSFEITSFTAKNNFIANDVYYLQRKDSLIWMSSEKGLLALSHKLLKRNKIQFYKNISNEFPSERINFFNVTNRSIWAVSDHSIKIIPTKMDVVKSKPIFYYELRKPDGVGENTNLVIDYKSTIQLDFGFISFHNQNIFTRYRISKNNDWTEISSRSIDLQSVAPGEYDLTLEYSMDKENWNQTLSLPFKVNPPWWNTWYFRSATLLFALGIGVVVYKVRIARYKEKNAYLGVINEQQKKLLNAEIEATERERTRIAKDLHDGISIDLVSIKLMANRIASKIDEKDALEIEAHIQKTIAEIKDIIYGLTPPGLKLFGLSAGLQNYISMISKNHPVAIKLEALGEEIKDQQIGSMIFRIIQELITNSIKHSHCDKISIDLNVSSQLIEIIYRDNGIGFDLSNIKSGLGLSNIQSRVDSLSGQIQVESDSTGTFYSINLPFKNS
jgi:signal transduction histidine kinase